MTATRLSFSYPEELKEKLQTLAIKDSRSLSSYVQKILLEHIDNERMSLKFECNLDSKPAKKKTRRKVKCKVK